MKMGSVDGDPGNWRPFRASDFISRVFPGKRRSPVLVMAFSEVMTTAEASKRYIEEARKDLLTLAPVKLSAPVRDEE